MRGRHLLGLLALVVVALGAPARADDGPAPPKIHAALWVGGFAHDFDAFASALSKFLPERIPIEVTVVHDGSFLDSASRETLDVIVMDHCFETTEGVLSEAQQAKLLELVRSGVGVVAIHASYYSFVAWDAIREVYGAKFTVHGSSEIDINVRIVDDAHPITRGLAPTFTVRSELYQSTPIADDCHLLAVAKEAGSEKEWPSAWTHQYGEGRVVTILPAHWPEAYQVEGFQKLIANGTLWAAGRLDEASTENGAR
jgi:type 1 glutamine amidotransferase